MNESERLIFENLVKNDGYAYMAPGQNKLYCLMSPEEGMIRFDHDFRGMTPDQINQFIVDQLT